MRRETQGSVNEERRSRNKLVDILVEHRREKGVARRPLAGTKVKTLSNQGFYFGSRNTRANLLYLHDYDQIHYQKRQIRVDAYGDGRWQIHRAIPPIHI